ncbi:MAG: hypothetical protein WBL21_09825 [Salinimicrobium sp.]
MINLRRHTNIALAYFLLVALLGLFLRLFFVVPIPANFRYVVHGHSHIALLGWVYLSLTTLIYKMYLSEEKYAAAYKRIFWFTQLTLLGMLFTFPFTGYAMFSITFSTLFLFASYLMAWFILKRTPARHRNRNSFKCIKASLWYLVISSIGPWAVGGVMATLGKTSIWYKMSIYFYLHFQYNAWFIFALCGILLYFLEQRNITPQKRHFQSFFKLLNVAVVLSFFLSVLWVEPHWIFYVLAGTGAVLQLFAFRKFFVMLKDLWKDKRLPFSPFQQNLLKIVGILLLGKILLQLLSGIPFFAELAFTYINLVIGYLHWTFLGVVSISLFVFLETAGLYRISKPAFWVYFGAFCVTEVLIFSKSIAIWLGLPLFADYYKLLAAASSFFAIAIGIFLVKNILTKKTEY